MMIASALFTFLEQKSISYMYVKPNRTLNLNLLTCLSCQLLSCIYCNLTHEVSFSPRVLLTPLEYLSVTNHGNMPTPVIFYMIRHSNK